MPNNGLTDRVIAQTCQAAMSYRLISYEAIRDWGDELIVVMKNPPVWAIDLACCSAHNAINRLLAVPGEADESQSDSLLLGLVSIRFRTGHLKLSTLRQIGWDMYGKLFNSQADHWGLKLDLAMESQAEGYGAESEVEAIAGHVVDQFAHHEQLVPEWMRRTR